MPVENWERESETYHLQPEKEGKQQQSDAFISMEEYNGLLKKVEDLILNNSDKKLIGLTLKDLVEKCDTSRGKMQHLLARLGKKVKRTKHGTYFHMMSCRISKKRRAELFY